MILSVVTTLYKSASYLPEFYARTKKTVEQITDDYELIFVDDGSPDNSAQVIREIAEKDDKVTLVELNRNYGHHKAIMTGFAHTKGDYVYNIDCDLEEDPEILLEFWQVREDELKAGNHIGVITAQQVKRKGNWFEKLTGGVFFKIINFLSDVKVIANPLSARLMSRKCIDDLLEFKEQELIYVGIEALSGHPRKVITGSKKDKGSSTYSLRKKIQVAIHYITSLSALPLVYIFYLGCGITLFSLAEIFWLLLKKFIFGAEANGWVSIMASMWLIGGILIFCVGVVGIYISIIFTEVKKRPYTLVRDVFNTKNSEQ